MVQLASAKSRHEHRVDRGGFQKWTQAHAPARGHIGRDPTQAR